MTDIMLDLETLGLRPGAVVLGVGAVAFDRRTWRIESTFYQEISIASSCALGLVADPQTVAWWAAQGEEARAILAPERQAEAKDVAHIAKVYVDWHRLHAGPRDPVWAQGSDMDPPIWAEVIERAGLEVPWRYGAKRDTRTAYDVLGLDPARVPREGIHHNALDDALHQVRCLRAAFEGDVL